MRTLAAILLWGILLFNWIGYRLVDGFMQQNATRQLEARIDKRQYDESQLITIKVPVTHLPYYNRSISFERVNGQIEIDGIPYQYVERRIFNDSLELLCIPNQMALKQRISGDEYFRTINDIQHSVQDHQPSHPQPSKSFIGDPYTITDRFCLEALTSMAITHSSWYTVTVPGLSLSADDRPPTSSI